MSRASMPELGTYSGPEAAASSWEKVLEAPQQLSVLSTIFTSVRLRSSGFRHISKNSHLMKIAIGL